jgi:hypothetical protein
MSDEARKRPGSTVGKALLLLGSFVLYVLSSAPVLMLSDMAPHPIVRGAVKLFYLPILLANWFVPFFSDVWLGYFMWWGRWGRWGP